MFTRIAVTALTLTVLGAGAFAFAPTDTAPQNSAAARTTILEKNQAWPIKGRITVNPCAVEACQEV